MIMSKQTLYADKVDQQQTVWKQECLSESIKNNTF